MKETEMTTTTTTTTTVVTTDETEKKITSKYLDTVFHSTPEHKILIQKMLKAVEFFDEHRDFIEENPTAQFQIGTYSETSSYGRKGAPIMRKGDKWMDRRANIATWTAIHYGMKQINPDEFQENHARFDEISKWLAVVFRGSDNGESLFGNGGREEFMERLFDVPPTILPDVLTIAFLRYMLQTKNMMCRVKNGGDSMITIRNRKINVWQEFFETFHVVINIAFNMKYK